MKLALVCLCVLHVALVGAGLFARDGARAPQSTGSSNQGRQRPLFARRGQHVRQSVPKPRAVPVPPSGLSPSSRVTPKPVKPKCSQLTQSCLPQSGCCDPYSTCHCRFFNAICFCRRTNSKYEKKT
ncbi:agouti-related protein-like [Xiphias gladius]|uniref:agouti-related protein-like n=1 Tax=Xiphias gladius TaxID=8245 RepID=UPI001A983AC6|nr:agouti-related protein-like [Xiphias gladius]